AAPGPLERPLGAVLLPDLRGPAALQDEGELLVQMVLHVQGLAGWNLADEHAALCLVSAGQLDEGGQAATSARPGSAGKRGDVSDAGDGREDRNAFRLHPA